MMILLLNKLPMLENPVSLGSLKRIGTRTDKPMTSEIITILAAFSSEFTRPTWKNSQTLFLGAILCRGARRITSILRVMDLCNERNFSKYHRVLSRAAWSELALSKILLGLLIKMVLESWPILIAVDETLEL